MSSVNKRLLSYLILILAILAFSAGKFSCFDQEKYILKQIDSESENQNSFSKQGFNKLKPNWSFDGLAIFSDPSSFLLISYLFLCLILFQSRRVLKTRFNFSSRSPPFFN